LEHVAQALQTSVRAGVDTVARYGGDEFIAILPDADEYQATLIGQRMREAIEEGALPAGHRRTVTISAGATAVRGEAGLRFSADDLIATADKALYKAKELGRNRVVYSGLALNASQSHLALG
jgi:diguanylate cyclase (GGDEF)-like protein